VLVAPPGAAVQLRRLVRAHERERPVRVLGPREPSALAEALVGASGVLVVGDRRRAPRGALPGPVLHDAEGRPVPAGWLPDVRPLLGGFAAAAARVLRRGVAQPGPLALLSQWQPRYLRLAARMDARLATAGGPPFPLLRWTSERITRDDLASGLRSGLGLAIYFGHGRPSGWAGYHGLRAHHLVGQPGEPLGAMLSVTCLTASRWRVGLSFSEAVTLGGAAAGAVGAVAEVGHLTSMRWMLGLADALCEGETRLGPALVRALPPDPAAAHPYRILGDPLAPLIGTPLGADRAARVPAPAAEHAWT